MVQDKLKKSFSILGMGTVVVDHQVVVRELPEPDAKAEILSDRFQVGGPVPTALALLTRFGASTSLIGKWATDRWGEMIEDDLETKRELTLARRWSRLPCEPASLTSGSKPGPADAASRPTEVAIHWSRRIWRESPGQTITPCILTLGQATRLSRQPVK